MAFLLKLATKVSLLQWDRSYEMGWDATAASAPEIRSAEFPYAPRSQLSTPPPENRRGNWRQGKLLGRFRTGSTSTGPLGTGRVRCKAPGMEGAGQGRRCVTGRSGAILRREPRDGWMAVVGAQISPTTEAHGERACTYTHTRLLWHPYVHTMRTCGRSSWA